MPRTQSFGETRCVDRAGEREVSAQLTQAGKESLRSHSSEGQKALGGNPMHCLHLTGKLDQEFCVQKR